MRSTWVAVAIALVASPALSREGDVPRAARALSRDEAVQLAARRAPEVQASRAPEGALGAVARAASQPLAAPPRLGVQGGLRQGATFGPEVGVSVSQELWLRGIGKARGDLATSLSRAVRDDIERAKVEAAARAALSHVDALEAAELRKLRRAFREQAEGLSRVARVRVDKGAAAPLERALADSEVGAAKAAELDAEGLEVEALARLRHDVGAAPDEAIVASGDLHAIDAGEVDEGAAKRAAERSARVQAADSKASLAQQEARLAHASQGPTMQVGAAFMHEGTGERTYLLTLGLPLPFIDHAAFERSRLEGAAMGLSGEAARVKAEAQRDVALALHERKHAREVLATLSRDVRGPLRDALRVATSQYEGGAEPISTVLLVRQRLVSTEEQITRAEAAVHRADIRAQLAQGTLITPGSP